jgi:hypothetical protein
MNGGQQGYCKKHEDCGDANKECDDDAECCGDLSCSADRKGKKRCTMLQRSVTGDFCVAKDGDCSNGMECCDGNTCAAGPVGDTRVCQALPECWDVAEKNCDEDLDMPGCCGGMACVKTDGRRMCMPLPTCAAKDQRCEHVSCCSDGNDALTCTSFKTCGGDLGMRCEKVRMGTAGIKANSYDEKGNLKSFDENGNTKSRDHNGKTISKDVNGFTKSRDENGITMSKDENGNIKERDNTGKTISKDEYGHIKERDENGITMSKDENGEIISEDEIAGTAAIIQEAEEGGTIETTSSGSIVIDDWTFISNMYEAGNPEKDLASKAYKKCDGPNIMCIKVLAEMGNSIAMSPSDSWIKDYDSGLSGFKYVDQDGDIDWIMDGGKCVGWQNCFIIPAFGADAARKKIEIHANYGEGGGACGRTTSTGKKMQGYMPMAVCQ